MATNGIRVSEPINMSGEMDAYAHESIDDAQDRLFRVACECGHMVTRGQTDEGPHLTVWADCYEFRIVWTGGVLRKILRRDARPDGGEFRAVWLREWSIVST
jgi:hypothetical protein